MFWPKRQSSGWTQEWKTTHTHTHTHSLCGLCMCIILFLCSTWWCCFSLTHVVENYRKNCCVSTGFFVIPSDCCYWYSQEKSFTLIWSCEHWAVKLAWSLISSSWIQLFRFSFIISILPEHMLPLIQSFNVLELKYAWRLQMPFAFCFSLASYLHTKLFYAYFLVLQICTIFVISEKGPWGQLCRSSTLP